MSEEQQQPQIDAEFSCNELVKFGDYWINVDSIVAIGPMLNKTTCAIIFNGVTVTFNMTAEDAYREYRRVKEERKKQIKSYYDAVVAPSPKEEVDIDELRDQLRKDARQEIILAGTEYIRKIAAIEAGEYDDCDDDDEGEDEKD